MKKVTIDVLPPAEAAQHPEFSGSVPLGAAGGYVLPAEPLPEDVGVALHYPSVRCLLGDFSPTRLHLFDVVRRLKLASAATVAHASGLAPIVWIEQELQAMCELQLIRHHRQGGYEQVYSHLEITL